MNKGGKSKKKRGIFKDTAFWKSDVTSDAQGLIHVTTTALPDNLTTWNIEVLVNTSPETQVAVAQTTVITNKLLMVQENLPQFFGAGDTIVLKPLIVNKMGKDAKIQVSLQATHIQVKNATQTINLASGASSTVSFELAVDQLLDLQKVISQLTITAKDTDSSIEDSIQKYLPINPTSVLETTTTLGKGAAKPEKEHISLK